MSLPHWFSKESIRKTSSDALPVASIFTLMCSVIVHLETAGGRISAALGGLMLFGVFVLAFIVITALLTSHPLYRNKR